MDLSSLENHRKNGYSIRESEPHEDGTYSETIEADGTEISDGVWGCVAYSAITSLQEADMAMAFEHYLDTDYEFNTDFQKKMAEYLSQEYMDYINDQNLSVSEAAVDIDLNEDGDKEDVADLTIEYDAEKYADTNGYGGTYLTFYLKEFEKSLEWYLENLDYADDWTWFDSDGNALSDEAVAEMTTEEKTQAFLEGRYAKGQSGENAGPGGMMGGAPDGNEPDGNGSAKEDDLDLPLLTQLLTEPKVQTKQFLVLMLWTTDRKPTSSAQKLRMQDILTSMY